MVPSAYPPEAMWHHQDALNWILMSLVINAWWRAKTVTSWMTSNTELLPVANLAGGRETWARATVSIGNLVLLDTFSQLPFYSLLFKIGLYLSEKEGWNFSDVNAASRLPRWNFGYRWGSLLISQTKAIFFRNEREKKKRSTINRGSPWG